MLRVHTFRQLISAAASHFGGRPLFVDDRSLGSVTYSDLLRFAYGLDSYFLHLGLPPGACIATLFDNCAMAVLLFFSIIATRRVMVPLDVRIVQNDLDYIITSTECAAVIADSLTIGTRQFGDRIVRLVHDHREFFAQTTALGVVPATQRDLGSSIPFSGEIVFTVDISGRLAGVALSEESLIAEAVALSEVYDLSCRDRFLTIRPLSSTGGQIFSTLACALNGGWTVAVDPTTAAFDFWHYAEKYRPTWSFGTASLLQTLLADASHPGYPAPTRGLLATARAGDGTLIQSFESRFGVSVRSVYALTEASSVVTCEYPNLITRSLGSAGQPLHICRVRLEPYQQTSAPAKELQMGEPRQILVSGANLFDRYVDNPALTLQRRCDGWFRTGDIGYFDREKNLFILDRAQTQRTLDDREVYL